MRVLVLGGTRFVGRAVVAEALARGHDVAALNRGATGALPAGARQLVADRTDPGALEQALGQERFDLVVDTWAQAPRHVQSAARALRARTTRYAYVSSESVYVPGRPPGGDESAPVVDGHPDAGATDYAADKRGGELAALESFPDALLLRAGMILGPHEDVGRLPWWLSRIARGGPVVAPGRPERPLQYVDARDLAAYALDAAATGVSGPVDVTCRTGEVTFLDLLEACLDATGSTAQLVWVDEEDVLAAGVQPWTELPCWLPERGEHAGFMESDTGRAHDTGLVCRPVEETVADTWRWIQAEGAPPQRRDLPRHGLPREAETALLGLGSST